MLNLLPTLTESPSQTAGPYVHIGLTPNQSGIHGVFDDDLGSTMLTPDTQGERITITGRIFDGSGSALVDAVVEIWQADAKGEFASSHSPNSNSQPGFLGWGRKATDDSGLFRFETVKPGAVTTGDGIVHAPHISLWIVARGINVGLHTRLYFEDEAEANAIDPVMNRVMPHRRGTLIARRGGGGNLPEYALDVHLQGGNETVFFDI